MAKATIGTIVADLVETRGGGRGGAPRPKAGAVRVGPIRLAGDAFVGLGFELNVDYVAAVALDLAGDVALSRSTAVGVFGACPH